jgi:RHS repeat-associated protein
MRTCLYDFCRRTRITTYERDAESDLDYARNRYFANKYGRFQSVDQGGRFLHRPATLSRYLYTENDPTNKTDRSGNSADEEGPHPPPPLPVCLSPIDGCNGVNNTYDPNPLEEARNAENNTTIEQYYNQLRINQSRDRVEKLLGNDNCAKAIGAKNSKDAVKKAHGISIGYGQSNLTMNAEGNPAGTLAHYNPTLFFRGITLNSNVNWDDPNATLFTNPDGTQTSYNILAAYAARAGSGTPFTVSEFIDMTILHELAHSFGYTGKDGHADTLDPLIWSNCFKKN